MKWFMRLCIIFNVKGEAEIMLKFSGKGATTTTTPEEALIKLKEGLESEKTGFIYHS